MTTLSFSLFKHQARFGDLHTLGADLHDSIEEESEDKQESIEDDDDDENDEDDRTRLDDQEDAGVDAMLEVRPPLVQSISERQFFHTLSMSQNKQGGGLGAAEQGILDYLNDKKSASVGILSMMVKPHMSEELVPGCSINNSTGRDAGS